MFAKLCDKFITVVDSFKTPKVPKINTEVKAISIPIIATIK